MRKSRAVPLVMPFLPFVMMCGWIALVSESFARELHLEMQAQAMLTPPPVSNAVRRIEVWIDLSAAPPTAWPALTPEQIAQYLRTVDAQQASLLERLQRWPTVEYARVRIVRNAVAVEVPESALDEIRRLPDVTGIRPVTHRQRIHSETPQSPPASR